MKVEIDADLCAGYGVCMGIAPDVFDLTDDGYSAVTIGGDVPAASEAAVRKAVAQCPNHAITIVE
jgi:ferredoxin